MRVHEHARLVTKAPPSPIWSQGRRITQNAWGPLRRQFRLAVAELQAYLAGFSTAAVIDPTFNLLGMLEGLPWDAFGERLAAGFRDSAEKALRASTRASLVQSDNAQKQQASARVLEISEQLATKWLEEHSFTLARSLSDTTRAGVQEILAQGIQDGASVPQLTKQIRQIIGLTPRDIKLVLARKRKLLAAGVSDAKANKGMLQLWKRKLGDRAESIARTEMITARNQGTLQAWQAQQLEGQLSPQMMKRWIAADPCPICTELHSAPPIPLNQPFQSSILGRAFPAPPAHVRCRCSMGLVRVEPKPQEDDG